MLLQQQIWQRKSPLQGLKINIIGTARYSMKFLTIFICVICATCAFAFESQESVDTSKQSVIEATLLQVSKLPPAKDNPYPDCYYTAIIETDHIASGKSMPRKVILVLPGFFSRQYAPEANLKAGEKVRATVVPFASMPDRVRQTQQADEIEDVDLDFYFPQAIAPISSFESLKPAVPFLEKKSKSGTPASFAPVDAEAKVARQEQIQRDLKAINELLARHNGDWDTWYKSLSGFRASYDDQYRAQTQKWLGNSFFSAGYLDSGRVYSPDFIKSVVAFKNYLAERNVDLILVRVPNKGEIVDDLFAPMLPDQVANPYLLRMYKELLEADVEIITDIIPAAKAARLNYPLMYYYQDFPEIHPAEGMAWVVAEALAKRVNRYKAVHSVQKKQFALKDALQPSKDFKWPKGNPNFNANDYVHFSAVTHATGTPVALEQGTDSQVLVLGSSFIAYPSIYKGGSIPHYLAYLTGVIPDVLHRSGADRTIPRSVAREGDEFLRGRSVCLYPFIPSTPYGPLAAPPIFNAEKSAKTLLASYSGPSLNRAVEFGSDIPAGVVSYSADGMVNIGAANGLGVAGTLRLKVPDAVAGFPYFSVAIEFASKDITNVTAKYSGQVDTSYRSDTQLNNTESFAFASKPATTLELQLAGSKTFVRTVTIKRIDFFGVREPVGYKPTEPHS